MLESRSIVLSRYFDGNVQFIARNSTEIYEESEVKIVGINLAFLKQYDKKLWDEISGFTDRELDHGLSVQNFDELLIRKKYSKIGLSNKNMDKMVDVKTFSISSAKNKDLQKVHVETISESFYDEDSYFFDWRIEEVVQKSNSPLEERCMKSEPFWVPPRSPHNLIEELLYENPWALLVATVFLNKTNCAVAKPHLFKFLLDHRGPPDVLDKLPSDLEGYFAGLGLQRTRAVQVYRMSYDYVFKKWRSVRELFGIGHYGDCAFRMFCLGDFSVEPRDRYLRIYKGWYEKVHSRLL